MCHLRVSKKRPYWAKWLASCARWLRISRTPNVLAVLLFHLRGLHVSLTLSVHGNSCTNYEVRHLSILLFEVAACFSSGEEKDGWLSIFPNLNECYCNTPLNKPGTGISIHSLGVVEVVVDIDGADLDLMWSMCWRPVQPFSNMMLKVTKPSFLQWCEVSTLCFGEICECKL